MLDRARQDRLAPDVQVVEAREEAFADQVARYWVNFATSGNPNGGGLPHWPPISELGPDEVMVLDADGSGVGPWIGNAKAALYAAIYDERVARPLGIAGD